MAVGVSVGVSVRVGVGVGVGVGVRVGVSVRVSASEHNTFIPHWAFNGQTPVEVFSGRSAGLDDQFATKRVEARGARLDENRRTACGACPNVAAPPDPVP